MVKRFVLASVLAWGSALACDSIPAADRHASYPESRIEATVAKYQHILRLDDYEIVSYVQSAKEIQSEVGNAWAYSETNTDWKVIRLTVMSVDSYYSKVPCWTDEKIEAHITEAIVHELVHGRLTELSDLFRTMATAAAANIEDKDAINDLKKALSRENSIEEAVVVRISRALIAAEKAGQE